MTRARAIALVGLRCSGKTTLGRALARELGLGFVDLDDAVAWAASEGCCAQHIPTVAHVVETLGWDGFRELESRELRRVLESGAELVVATGGGVVESPANREFLRAHATCVWLEAPLETLRKRLALDPTVRPSLTGRSAADELAEIAARREPCYREVAAHSLDTSQESPEALARALARRLRTP